MSNEMSQYTSNIIILLYYISNILFNYLLFIYIYVYKYINIYIYNNKYYI